MEQVAWQQVLAEVKKRVKPAEYRNWFKPLQILDDTGGNVRVVVRDGRFQEWFAQKYQSVLEEELERSMKRPVRLEYKIQDPELFDFAVSSASSSPSVSLPPHTFDDFVAGPSNLMAYAAGKAVGDQPGRSYNPLFIYGGVGLGKTHLLCAIGNLALANNPSLRLLYLTCENYVNDLMLTIRTEKWDQFRRKYRDECDILLVDDIQFMAGKERTQIEFFHTFNALHAAHKQIVFTSDRAPQEIPQLEDRLRSRFEWGLIADIKPPELETRIEILRRKSERLFGMALSDELAGIIAEEVSDNVRELESCLNRLHLEMQIKKGSLSAKDVRECIKNYYKKQIKRISVEAVQRLVAVKYGVTVEELVSASRRKELTLPRHVAMYLCRRVTASSFPEIGEKFGGRDHTSVMSGYRKIERALRLDSKVVQVVEELEQRLRR